MKPLMDWNKIYLILLKVTKGDEEQAIEALNYLKLGEKEDESL